MMGKMLSPALVTHPNADITIPTKTYFREKLFWKEVTAYQMMEVH